MNKCLYKRFRHKNGILYAYCTKIRQEVPLKCEIECIDKEYKKNKQIKKKTKKQQQFEDSRYSIIQEDLSKCYFCNKKAVDWHEMAKGRNRKNCIKWGLCIRVCRECHTKTEEDSNFYKEIRKLAQLKWQNYYGKEKEDFIKEFGRNYLD